MVYVTMLITIMFVILMVVIAAINIPILHSSLTSLEMPGVLTFITLKCAIMTKGIVVTTQELLMGSVMTQTITEFATMMEETAALD